VRGDSRGVPATSQEQQNIKKWQVIVFWYLKNGRDLAKFLVHEANDYLPTPNNADTTD